MSQNDFNIANQGFPQFRADLNSALQALASNSSGAAAPGTTYAYQLWYDTSTNLLKMRNADNDNWITLAAFDQAADEWQIRSAVIQAVDGAGVVIKTDEGTTRLTVADDGTVTLANNLVVTGDISAATINGITQAIATQAEAEAGTDNTKLMTPLRTEQSILSNLATQAEAEAGTENTKLMTPLRTEQALTYAFNGGSGAPKVLPRALQDPSLGYQTFTNTAFAVIGLSGVESLFCNLRLSNTAQAGAYSAYVSFSNNNGDTWGALQTLRTLAPGDSFSNHGFINLRTGELRLIGDVVLSFIATVPANCNAIRFNSNNSAVGGSVILQIAGGRA